MKTSQKLNFMHMHSVEMKHLMLVSSFKFTVSSIYKLPEKSVRPFFDDKSMQLLENCELGLAQA